MKKPNCHSYSCKLIFECADKYGGDINVVPPCGNRRACSQYSVEDLHKVLTKTMNFMAALCCGNQLKARELMSDEAAQKQIVHFVKQLSDNVNFVFPPLRFLRKNKKEIKKQKGLLHDIDSANRNLERRKKAVESGKMLPPAAGQKPKRHIYVVR